MELHVSVGMGVILAHVLQESSVSQLDCSRVCLDFKRLDAIVVCSSAGNDDSFFVPLSTYVVLNDNTIFDQEFVNCCPALLEGEVDLVLVPLLDHLLVLHMVLHCAWEQGFGTPLVKAFMGAPSASRLDVGVYLETEFTQF